MISGGRNGDVEEDRRAEVSPEAVEVSPEAGHNTEFESLLAYMKYSRGFDFLGYKRASLMRRVDRQMESVGVAGYGEYVDYLEVHPEEFGRLFNTILINVTAFFRDAPTWDYLAEEIIPRLLAAKGDSEPIRLWSAGCAAGQEAYSLAMLLAERIGVEAFRRRVKIYATDVDDEALTQARSGSYTAREVHGVPAPLLEKYFGVEGGRYVFHKELRRGLIFGRHDLLRDAPISRIDLLACRNALMYFNTEVQAQILARFHFGVADGGYLCLGKAEMLFSHASLFLPLDLKRRVFIKAPRSDLRDRLLLLMRAGGDPAGALADDSLRLREAVFQSGPVAQIVVDRGGALALANERALALFRLTARDLGRPLQDLELSYRPVELRSLIEQVGAGRRAAGVKEAAYTLLGAEPVYLDVLVVPLQEGGVLLGTAISFNDVTRSRHLSEELQEAGRALETAYEELQSSNEELETTNEELQSTVEELETTNEELQSTNEELETTNEELQSTNEELQTINDELRVRSGELDHVNGFLESILGSLRGSVIVLDGDLRVQIWNGRSQELWGLRAEEAEGKAFLALDIGLPVEALVPAIRACLAGLGDPPEVTVSARNRRGRAITCRVRFNRLPGAEGIAHGILLVVEEQPPAGGHATHAGKRAAGKRHPGETLTMPERKTPKPDATPTRAEGAPSRADGPRREAVPAAAPGRGLLTDALEELNATVEELRVAEEEMRAQNEELMQTRLRVEAERHRYQDLFEFAPDAYLITDRDGRVLEANRAASELLGIAPRFLKGRGLGTSVAPEDLAAYAAVLRDADAPAQELELRLRRRHAGLFPAAVSVTRVAALGDQPATLRWLVRDVTERRRAEEERLSHSHAARSETEGRRQQIAAALDAVPERFVTLDREWHITSLNAAAARLADAFGLDPDALIGQVLWEAFPEALGTAFHAQALHVAEIRRPAAFEQRSRRLGRLLLGRLSPTEDGVVVFCWDSAGDAEGTGETEGRLRIETARLTSPL